MAQYNHSVVMHLGGTNKKIIDTETTDHVTSDPRVFDELCDYVRDPYITSANGAPSPVKGEGIISLTPTLSLVCALLIPDVICNLLSVGKLLDTLYCSTHFYPTYCYFQDIQTQKIIGHGKRIGGLYILTIEDTVVFDSNNHQALSAKVDGRHQIWLWHRRLGHPSFSYMKHLFPSLFRTCSDSKFQCETCVMAKSHRHSFPISDSKATLPFDLIHSDVWGYYSSDDYSVYTLTKWCVQMEESSNNGDCSLLDTPFDVLQKHVSLVSVSKLHPKVFGRIAYVHVYSHQQSKLDACALRCGEMGSEVQIRRDDMDDVLQAELGIEPIMLRDTEQSAIDSDRSLVIPETISTDDRSYMPNKLPISMSDELPSDDQLPAAGMSNALPDDGSSSDDSSNNLLQDDGIHEFNVKNNFLHGDLKEEVYMDLPPGIGTSPGRGVSHSDHTLFLKQQTGKLTALIIYVDDMIVSGNDQKEIQRLQKYLATEFEMKELDCKPVDTPIEQNHRLGLIPNQIPTHKEQYQRLVGRLIYLSHTRPDIAYAVSVVSQSVHSPSEAHMDVVTRILRYLKMALGRGLVFSKNSHLNVEGYTNADSAGSITDRQSTSGYFTFVGGNLVTWRSKKQKMVAISSAEAEFHVQHDQTKHVEIDRYFIKEKLDAGIIMFPFVGSEDQLDDVLTKDVSNSVFSNSLDKLSMRDIFAPT
ncbi:uncharacterized protein [Malus domestica]|uniref:uncharacterized protein n=1 Tax=Malus domestica TaxID=3750 RepID=UPI003976D9A8